MLHEPRYEAALAAAMKLLNKLDARPGMPRHEQLSVATYTILDAMSEAERRAAALPAGRDTTGRKHP